MGAARWGMGEGNSRSRIVIYGKFVGGDAYCDDLRGAMAMLLVMRNVPFRGGSGGIHTLGGPGFLGCSRVQYPVLQDRVSTAGNRSAPL